MFNCKQAVQLASSDVDQKLRLSKRISLKLHLLICRYCRRYSHQLNFIHRATKQIDQHIESQDKILSTEGRKKLEQIISSNGQPD